MYNAVGCKRQELIVCATLVDKAPNLAGLTRTCEVFGASKVSAESATDACFIPAP